MLCPKPSATHGNLNNSNIGASALPSLPYEVVHTPHSPPVKFGVNSNLPHGGYRCGIKKKQRMSRYFLEKCHIVRVVRHHITTLRPNHDSAQESICGVTLSALRKICGTADADCCRCLVAIAESFSGWMAVARLQCTQTHVRFHFMNTSFWPRFSSPHGGSGR